jgi:hypothetical protein
VNGIYLSGDSLFSKYGFNDGDMPDALMDWLDADHPSVDYSVEDWHPVLVQLVRGHLLPLLPDGLEVYEIDTIHNPIRARSLNGVDTTHLERALDLPAEVARYAAVNVLVPFEDVLALLEASPEGPET